MLKCVNKNILKETVKFSEDVFVTRAFQTIKNNFANLFTLNAKNWKKIFIFLGKTGKKRITSSF